MSRTILFSLIGIIVAQFQTAPTTPSQTATLRVAAREIGTSKFLLEGVRVRLTYVTASARVPSPLDPSPETTISRVGHALLNIVDSDVSNVVVHIDDGITVKGRIVLDNMTDEMIVRFQQLRLTLTTRQSPAPPSSPMFSSSPRADIDLGKFAFPNMAPGKYSVSFGSELPSGFYISDILQNQKSVFSDGIIDVRAGQTNDIEIVLKQGHASVIGSIQNLNAIDRLTTAVVLVPEPELRTNPMLYRTTTIDTDGGFTIQDVPPGNYTLLAWTNMPKGAEQNPEIFAKYERLGNPVTVKENESLHVQMETIR